MVLYYVVPTWWKQYESMAWQNRRCTAFHGVSPVAKALGPATYACRDDPGSDAVGGWLWSHHSGGFPQAFWSAQKEDLETARVRQMLLNVNSYFWQCTFLNSCATCFSLFLPKHLPMHVCCRQLHYHTQTSPSLQQRTPLQKGCKSKAFRSRQVVFHAIARNHFCTADKPRGGSCWGGLEVTTGLWYLAAFIGFMVHAWLYICTVWYGVKEVSVYCICLYTVDIKSRIQCWTAWWKTSCYSTTHISVQLPRFVDTFDPRRVRVWFTQPAERSEVRALVIEPSCMTERWCLSGSSDNCFVSKASRCHTSETVADILYCGPYCWQ